jgi:glycosyltransferase involved in cell wall biosynthesis
MHGSFDQHHLGPIAREAVCGVALARPRVRFRFVGRETEGLKRFALDVRKRVPGIRLELTGFIPYAEVGRELASATVGLVPYEESNGTHCAFVAKAVEYLGCGLGVASTPLENLQRYFCDEPGIRFGGFDGKSLASVILSWLDTPDAERDRIGAASSRRVQRELSWDVVSRNAVDFVEQTVRTAVRSGRKQG